MRRGELRWYTFAAPDKRRPVLLLTRVVPATRTIRGLETEVLLSPEDGMPTACALNFDHVSLAQRSRIGASITTLPPARWPEVERALLIACGFSASARER